MRLTVGFGMLGQVDDPVDHLLRNGRALRPRPAATFPNLTRPCASNRDRHERTVHRRHTQPLRNLLLATPSAASSNARARCTSRCGAVRDTDKRSSTSR